MATTGVQLYKHPEFERMQPHWTRYRDLYDGEHDTLISTEYLWPHQFEQKDDNLALALRSNRAMRTRYLNIPEIIVSLWTSLFFREDPVLDEATKKMLGEEEEDIDGQGTSLCGFIKDHILKSYLLYGRVYVLADSMPFAVRTQAQANALKLRPFLELTEPLWVPDWDIETENPRRMGRYNMLRREFDIVAPRPRATQIVEVQRISHEHYIDGGKYKVQIYKTEVDKNGQYKNLNPQTNQPIYELGDLIETKLDEIPVSTIIGDSWVHGVCEETLRHYNARSYLDNVNYYQGYQKIFVKGLDLSNPDQRMALSAYIVSGVPADGDVIFGEPVNTTSLEAQVSDSLQAAFKVGLNQLRALPITSKESVSAEAQSQEKEYTVAQVETALDDIEVCVNDALKNYARFKGIENFDGRVELNKDIETEDLDSWLKVYMAFKDKISQIPQVDKEAVKKAITKLKLAKEDELLDVVENAAIQDPNQQRQDLIAQIARGQTNQ